jgi:hypothetical protein
MGTSRLLTGIGITTPIRQTYHIQQHKGDQIGTVSGLTQ